MAVIVQPKPGIKAYVLFALLLVFVKPLLRLLPLSDAGLRRLRWLERAAARGPDVAGVERTRTTLVDRPTELFVPAGTAADAVDEAGAAVLYLHGGAFIACGPNTHRQGIGLLARRLRLPVYALDYRQLPDAGVGTSVDDAARAYRELVCRYGPGRVAVVGDSAGGFLCGKVVENAHANGLPKPTACVGYSPFLDLDLGNRPDSTSRHDAYLPKGALIKLTPAFDRGPVPFTGVRDVVAVTPEAFPPTLIITAQDEFVEPDAIRLVEKLSAAGIVARLYSYPWRLHAFPAFGTFTADGSQAAVLAADFIRQALAAAAAEGTAAEQAG